MMLYNKFVSNLVLRRWFVLIILIFILFLLKNILSLLILTFIFTYLINRFVKTIQVYFKIRSSILVSVIYLTVVLCFILLLTKFLPIILEQSKQMYNYLEKYYKYRSELEKNDYQFIDKLVSRVLPYIKNESRVFISSITNFTSLIITLFMSFILSFFFMIEKKDVVNFTSLFTDKDKYWFFMDIKFIGEKFTNTFGIVIETQFLIACINTLITSISLYLMGFPHLLSLSLMIFLFSFIPIAGVIMSCIPLTLIAYSNGGIKDVIYILITLMFVHMLESYVLNPKLMANKTNLPIFFSFLILVISEHFFNIWGLILGIPTFLFFLDFLNIKKDNYKNSAVKFEK